MTDDLSAVPLANESVALLEKALDLAIAGQVKSAAVVLVTAAGTFQIAAAGSDLDGLLAGADKLSAEILKLVPDAPKKKTALHIIRPS